jgi:hypothetical protein
MDTQQQDEYLYIALFTNEEGHTWTFSVDLKTGVTLAGDCTDWERIPLLDVGLDYPMYCPSLSLMERHWIRLCWNASRSIRNEYQEQLEKANLQYTEHVRQVLYDLWKILDILDDGVLADRLKKFFWEHGHQGDINSLIDSMRAKSLDFDCALRATISQE